MGKSGPPPRLTPEEFEEGVKEYIDGCIETADVPNIVDMALHLGFASRQSIYDYCKRDGYEHVATRARSYCESAVFKAVKEGIYQPAFAIFILKNFGWTDKQEIQHSEKVTDSGENEW